MVGTNMQAATVITPNVLWLETASHIVKLEVGSMLDGSKNGNNAKPAVRIAPIILKLVPIKLNPALFERPPSTVIKPPKMPITGAIMVIG